ncbi:hypothetical protein [Pseudomonas frederiksbergensis]|uniref:hypothetical protein n=1 Tax=Pseudomonas frederiksbergensis TaxID=104087 RepID=UPI000A7696CA|nr:hypothetical protein [Pseudomonas frederiksbergensis]
MYSSFLLFAQRPRRNMACRPATSWSNWAGGTVGGQEDMIEDLALDMARARQQQKVSA